MCHSAHVSRSYAGEAYPQMARLADLYPLPPRHCDSQLHLDALVSLETNSSSEDGIEETIVYLWTLSEHRENFRD